MTAINQHVTDKMALYHGDCVAIARQIPSNSIHYSVSSIPFAALYIWSNSERDMGNCRTYEEFQEHIAFMYKEWFRVMMPGRLVSIHAMNLPTSKVQHGYNGLIDFRGHLVRAMEEAGFIYHSEVCIYKDPEIAMNRTHSIRLLHNQLCKDSTVSGQGVPDYLVTFRKPGDNEEAVAHKHGLQRYIGFLEDEPQDEKADKPSHNRFSQQVWKRYASPIWMDIDPSKTLNRISARAEKDERHITPLQLQVIERGIQLWSNPGDVVYDPFGGIGSTGYVALKMGRKTIMSELKESYYKQNVLNCEAATVTNAGLFDLIS